MTLFDYPFMINALRAGTIVAVMSGAMGWFMVLRRQTFAGHTLSLVGFPGAAGAILIGLSPAFGYFGFCIAAVAMSHRIGETFDAIVTGVTPKGTFVRVLAPHVEGLLARGQQGVDVGDRLRVTLVRTDVDRGYIDFARA